jgi:hypothetical protein
MAEMQGRGTGTGRAGAEHRAGSRALVADSKETWSAPTCH